MHVPGRAGPYIIAEFPRYHRNPAIGIAEHTVITLGPNVQPAGFLQLLNYLSDLERHNQSLNRRNRSSSNSGPWMIPLLTNTSTPISPSL